MEDEEVLLGRLGVVETVRLAGLEDADVHADVLEGDLVAVLEAAASPVVAGRLPGGVAHVHDEPALARGHLPRTRLLEPCLVGHGSPFGRSTAP